MSQLQSMIPLNEHLRNLYNEALLSTEAVAIFFSTFESTEHTLKTMEKSGVRCKVLLGKYDGSFETSYAICAEHLEWLINSGLVDGQESLLLTNEQGEGYLVYNRFSASGELRIEPLGVIGEITKDEAARANAFTFNPEDGLYYGCVNKKAS